MSLNNCQTKLSSLLPFFVIALSALLSACSGDSGSLTTAPVPTVQNVSAVAGDQQVALSWDEVTNAESYSIYWNETGGVTESDNVIIATSNQVTHSGLTNDTTYYYRITATVTGQSGELSAEVSATPASPVLISWTTQNSGVTAGLSEIAWSGSLYVVVGASGTILTSPDGTSWTQQLSGTSNHLRAVHWNGNLFVATGDLGTILTSSNGTLWLKETSGTTASLNGIEWDGSQFVVVGTTGTAGIILTSPNGTFWSSQYPGTTSSLNDVVWNGTQFLAAGTGSVVLTSPDGINWTEQAITGWAWELLFHQVVWNGHQYLAVVYDTGANGGMVFTSTDGVTWSSSTFFVVGYALTAADWNGTQFLVAGESGLVFSNINPANNWTSQTSTTETLLDIFWNNDHYLAIGANGLIVIGEPATACPTGTTWNGIYCI